MTIMMIRYREGDEQDKLEILLNAIKQAFGPGGCACVIDEGYTFYTCVAHEFLQEVAKHEQA